MAGPSGSYATSIYTLSSNELKAVWAEDDTADELEMLARNSGDYSNIEHVALTLNCETENLIGSALEYDDGSVDLVTAHCPHFAQGFVTGAVVVFAEQSEVFGIDPDVIAEAS